MYSYGVIMVIAIERNDTAIRLSRWIDKAIEKFISDRKTRIEFPSKRNLVDRAVMQFLEERGVKLDK
jgi:hypothetical protein